MAKSTEASAPPRLQQKCKHLKKPVGTCIYGLIDSLYVQILIFHISQIEENFARALEKLNVYRAKRTQTNYSEASEEIKNLQQRKTLLVSLSVAKEPSFTSYVEKTVTKIFSLSTQINPSVQIQMATLVRNVQLACENKMPSAIEELNAQIANLPRDVQDRLDWWVHISPKDWNRLREALIMFTQRKWKRILRKWQALKLRHSSLHSIWRCMVAFGPPSPNPVDWAKKELVFLGELIPKAIDKIQQNKTGTSIFFFNQLNMTKASLERVLPRSV